MGTNRHNGDMRPNEAPRSGKSTPQVEEKGTTQWRGSRGRSPLVCYMDLLHDCNIQDSRTLARRTTSAYCLTTNERTVDTRIRPLRASPRTSLYFIYVPWLPPPVFTIAVLLGRYMPDLCVHGRFCYGARSQHPPTAHPFLDFHPVVGLCGPLCPGGPLGV